jgi:hypothetical protein
VCNFSGDKDIDLFQYFQILYRLFSMENQNILQRLDNYALKKGLNDNKITVDAGLSVGLLGKARKKEGRIGTVSIEKILSAYPDINPEWLLKGSGEMLRSMNRDKVQQEEELKNTTYEREREALQLVIAEKEKKIELLNVALERECELSQSKDKQIADLNREIGRLEERLQLHEKNSKERQRHTSTLDIPLKQ